MVLLIGSKVQVYRGLADITPGKLTRKDIVQVVDSKGIVRYKSKKQQNRKPTGSKWADAYKSALSELRASDPWYKTNVLMYNPQKKYKGVDAGELAKGIALYKLTKKIYTTPKTA